MYTCTKFVRIEQDEEIGSYFTALLKNRKISLFLHLSCQGNQLTKVIARTKKRRLIYKVPIIKTREEIIHALLQNLLLTTRLIKSCYGIIDMQ